MGVIARATDASDGDLVALVRAGDDCAFEELYRRYSRRVAGFVCRMVGDPDRAEDVTQEAFFSALRRLRQTEGEIVFKPWVFEIAKNAAIDHFRRTSRAEEISLTADDGALRPGDHLRLVGCEPVPEAAFEGKEQFDHLRGAFDELSESHSRILVLRELEGLSYREIGERMTMSRPAVESTLFRARRRLNEEYAELDTGARCLAIMAAIARLAEGIESVRDRRRVDRHAFRCSTCRRHARELGVAVQPPIRSRVAALVPLPALARRRRGDSHDGGAGAAAGNGYGFGAERLASTWAPAVVTSGAAEGAAHAWTKAVAIVATLALAGGGAAVHDRVIEPERGTPDAQVAPAQPEAGPLGPAAPAGGGEARGMRGDGRDGGTAPDRGDAAGGDGGVQLPDLGGGGGAPPVSGVPPVPPPPAGTPEIPSTPEVDAPSDAGGVVPELGVDTGGAETGVVGDLGGQEPSGSPVNADPGEVPEQPAELSLPVDVGEAVQSVPAVSDLGLQAG
jgi:RNA polymerase sigma factor (sigma-70 family)